MWPVAVTPVRSTQYALLHRPLTLTDTVRRVAGTWFKVPSKNVKSESGAERLGLVSMHAGEVSGAVLNLFGTLSSL